MEKHSAVRRFNGPWRSSHLRLTGLNFPFEKKWLDFNLDALAKKTFTFVIDLNANEINGRKKKFLIWKSWRDDWTCYSGETEVSIGTGSARYDSMSDFIIWCWHMTQHLNNNKLAVIIAALSAAAAATQIAYLIIFSIWKGGADDFRSWVSTNASPLLSLPVKIVNPPFLTYRPNLPPQSSASIFFFPYRCLLSRDARLKEKNLLQLASLNIFSGNELCTSVNGRKTHTHTP